MLRPFLFCTLMPAGDGAQTERGTALACGLRLNKEGERARLRLAAKHCRLNIVAGVISNASARTKQHELSWRPTRKYKGRADSGSPAQLCESEPEG